ncbi:MAG: hypothetical protein KatS3mg087_1170 [Patescibacteria group bacterium]|nr:MAG: hypothetical protein KatS3mg087_1170 [Patescibacteria group bacterium]
MTESEAIEQMIFPSQRRPSAPFGGIIQIHVTRLCDKACFNCTQASNLAIPGRFMSLENFEQAVITLKDYFGVVGVFGGNPCLHPKFEALCYILRKHIPKERCGLWSNRIFKYGKVCRETFNPAVSNLNVHLDPIAYEEIVTQWPEARPFGLHKDSRHAPVFVSMKDLGIAEEKRWELISRCDINQHWSAMICEVRGELRAFFCEIAAALTMLHEFDTEHDESNIFCPHNQNPFENPISACLCYSWPDTGLKVEPGWWRQPPEAFLPQVRQNCHHCGVPLRGYGTLAITDKNPKQFLSKTHANIGPIKKRPKNAPLSYGQEIVENEQQLKRRDMPVTKYVEGADL